MLRLGGSGRGTQTMLHFVGSRLRCSIKGSCYQSIKEPQNGSISLNNEQVDGRAVWKDDQDSYSFIFHKASQ